MIGVISAAYTRYKTLEMRQTLETTLSDVKQVDTYVSLQIFPHVQHQFQILVEDVDKISKTIMGYLQEYVHVRFCSGFETRGVMHCGPPARSLFWLCGL